MRSTLNISLPESLRHWVDEQVADGGYGSASEFVRELLRGEQKRRLREEIDAKLLEALGSGEPKPMTKKDWADLRSRLADHVARRKRP
jgi:antitoxin ParD1/3/4